MVLASGRSVFVMAGLVPAIHVFLRCKQDVDARVKPAHDGLAGYA
jgi:hypothetical protein